MRQLSFLILSTLALMLASCGNKGGKSGLLVPKDASIVVHINSSSLSSKIKWEEIRQTNWFKQMSKDATDTLSQQLLADPASSGIETKNDFIFYTKKQSRGGYLIFQGSLADAATFEKMLVKINEKEPKEIKKEGEFSYMASKESSIVIWNKSMFAVVANANMPDMKTPFPGNRRSSDEKFEFQSDSLKIFGQQALTLKNDDNLDADSRFASLVKDGSDVHVWMNNERDFSNMGTMLSMMNINALFKDNVSATSINFDNGKISAKAKQYYGEEMNKLLAKHKPESVSADVINRIPSQNVTAVFAFNYPPRGLQEFLKLLGVDGMANGYLSQMNYSMEEFIKANKGEMLIAITDLGTGTGPDTTMSENQQGMSLFGKTQMKWLFATSVNDKAAFEKLITLAWEASKGFSAKMPSISYKVENNWFAASNSPEEKDKFLAGGNNKLAFTDKLTGHPMGAYIDLQKIMQTISHGVSTDSSAKAGIDASVNMWQDIVSTGGEYKDKALIFDFEINLVDKNTNSLRQLNQYFEKLSSIQQARRKNMAMEDWDASRADSTTVVSP